MATTLRDLHVHQNMINIEMKIKTDESRMRPYDVQRLNCNNTKAKKLLNWKPKISIEKGIEMLLSNIHAWKDAPVWTPETIKEATANWFKLLKK